MGAFKDLTGLSINELTVLYRCDFKKNNKVYWHCRCSCGREIDVNSGLLTTGRQKSCGKCGKRKTNSVDLTGNVYGRLTVIGKHTERGKHNEILWVCKCSCNKGTIIYRSASVLNSGNVTSCGCLIHDTHGSNYKDLTGMKFGRYTVNYDTGKKDAHGNTLWHCTCECGNEKDVRATTLLQGKSLSCKCYAADVNRKRLAGKSTCDSAYPDWFINDLYLDSDKEMAKNHTLMTTERVQFNCSVHGIYESRVSDHIKLSTGEKRYGCPKCSGSIRFTGAVAENEIRDFILESTDFIVETHKHILEYGNRKKEIDIYLPELRLGIEYNGSAYHASKNNVYSDKPKYYHRDKFLQAKKQGIHLISIFDIDYEKNKDNILNFILCCIYNNILNIEPIENVIYTDNDFDDGEWLKEYGYVEVEQLEPDPYIYNNKYLVYRSGITKWENKYKGG